MAARVEMTSEKILLEMQGTKPSNIVFTVKSVI